MDDGDGAALLIIGQRVRPDREGDYRSWERRMLAAASRYPGYRGAEVKEPNDIQPDWVIVYRFDSVPHVQNWLNSSTRQELINEAADLFDGPGTRQVLSQGTEIGDPLVTVVIANRVEPDREQAFLAWRARMADAESHFPGFRGSEVFRPIPGVQQEWTTIYRFDTADNLDRWLTSPQRHHLLAEGGFGDFSLRTIDSSFGNWFAYEGRSAARPPSDFKTAIAVWLGLYPTVVLLTLLTAPLQMPFWLAMLVGNLLSSLVMSYVTMPYYGNRLLRWWLSPSPSAPQPATDIRGLMLVLAVNGAWAVIFYLLTVTFGVTSL